MGFDVELLKVAKDTAPEKIVLSGFAIDRTVYLDGTLINYQTDTGSGYKVEQPATAAFHSEYNWGYGGTGPLKLATAICLQLLPYDLAMQVRHTFKFIFIAQIKAESFTAEIKFRLWLERLYNEAAKIPQPDIKLEDLLTVKENEHVDKIEIKPALRAKQLLKDREEENDGD